MASVQIAIKEGVLYQTDEEAFMNSTMTEGQRLVWLIIAGVINDFGNQGETSLTLIFSEAGAKLDEAVADGDINQEDVDFVLADMVERAISG